MTKNIAAYAYTEETTTDLDKLRAGAKFTWGRVLEILDIGSYAVVEYIRNGEYKYHGYIDGKDTCRAQYTLDGILATCIALRWDGLNTQAHTYFLRMIGAEKSEQQGGPNDQDRTPKQG